jgi:hypothetical protein
MCKCNPTLHLDARTVIFSTRAENWFGRHVGYGRRDGSCCIRGAELQFDGYVVGCDGMIGTRCGW